MLWEPEGEGGAERMNARTRGYGGELGNTVSWTLCRCYTQELNTHGYLHKTKAINVASWMREGTTRLHIPLMTYWLLLVTGWRKIYSLMV